VKMTAAKTPEFWRLSSSQLSSSVSLPRRPGTEWETRENGGLAAAREFRGRSPQVDDFCLSNDISNT